MLPLASDHRAMSPAPPAIWSWGTGDRVLVFLHALLPHASGRTIEATARQLTTLMPIRVVGIDAPGFGESPALPEEEYDLDRLAARLGTVAADAATGPFVLAGHSWGAALAVRIAAAGADVVRGVVLLDGGHFDHADLPDADPNQTVDATLAEMAAIGWVKGSTVDPRAAAAAMNALMRSRSSASYPALAAGDIPVLLLTATEPEQRRRDNVARAARLIAALPHAEVHELPGAGHDVLVDAPHLVADLVAAWWNAEVDLG